MRTKSTVIEIHPDFLAGTTFFVRRLIRVDGVTRCGWFMLDTRLGSIQVQTVGQKDKFEDKVRQTTYGPV